MTRQRVTVSILLAVLVHAAVLLLVQLFVHLAPQRMPEYSGPLVVTLEETPMTPVLERVEERQSQTQPAAQPQPEPARTAQVQPQPQPPRAASRPEPQAQPSAAAAPVQPVEPPEPATASRLQPAPPVERPPQGSRQIVPAEPLGTLPPVAPEDATQSAPQSFTPPLSEQGPVQAAPSGAAGSEQAPPLDKSRLDSAIAEAEAGPSSGAPAASSGAAPGSAGAAQSTLPGFEILWQNPSEGRQVVQSEQPIIPNEARQEGRDLVVVVGFVLKPSGYLSDVRVVTGSGLPSLDSAVVTALRLWRFTASPGAADVRGEVTYRIIPR